MRTDPTLVHRSRFDVLVVGGGIHGVAIAREAALAGLSALLVEREDFACGTSSRSSRLIHGGVRYLAQGHLALVREALHERERLLRLARHLVRPLPMLMPFFRDGGKAGWQLRLGLWLYGMLAGRSTLPRPRAFDAGGCTRLFPGLRRRGLQGGVLYFDAATSDARLVLAVAEAAANAGALLANHTEVLGVRDGAVLLLDRLHGRELAVRATHIVNAAGPTADTVRRALGLGGPDVMRQSRGSHLVLAPIDCETALAAFLPDGRIQFVVPHPDGTLCGTTDVPEAARGEPTVPQADVDYLLAALGHLLQEPPGPADVRFAYGGWRSLPAAKGPPGALHREAFLVAERCAAGLVHTVVGGKLTTHRSFAERVAGRLLGHSWVSPSRTEPLPGGACAPDPSDLLSQRHGTRAGEVRALAAGEAALLEPICPHRPFLGVEALWGVQQLGAVTLADLALRRLIDSRGPCLEPECLDGLHHLWARAASAAGQDRTAAIAEVRSAVRTMVGAGMGFPAASPA